MAKGQVKKAQIQAENTIFAMDIGTRSIIGMVGVVEEDKVKIIAIDKEEHTERAMIDGQIENIEKVTTLAKKVKKRLEDKVHFKLNRVCVAAAGRALRTKRAEYEIDLPGKQLIDDEIISRLEAGAISKVEEAFDADNSVENDMRRFYLVGYTVCQYYLDDYRISSLKDHRGQNVKVDLIATFLPSEVVESLYTTMNKIGLEVVSITLEPIAAINAAIPENLRLLNLVMVDIGAGTSDIAACTDGSVTGYTMATVAGDEVTEAIMREYLVDFATAEGMKAQIEQEEVVTFTDILGFERKASREEVLQCIQSTSELLSKEIAQKILEVNGGPPSALFLAGGGSKLAGLKEGITSELQMDSNRVAIAGNNFKISAFSDEYDLNNPEYTTPLGITVSCGLNLINDSFRVTLNGRAAKLFRSGSFTALNLLMMNGYNFQDILGRPGTSLTVMVNGKRKVFYGTAAQPASLFINKKEGKLSEIINAGDRIDFEPAIAGIPAKACLGDIEGASECLEITLNGAVMPLETPLKVGDVIRIQMPKPEPKPEEPKEEISEREESAQESVNGAGQQEEAAEESKEPGESLSVGSESAEPGETPSVGIESKEPGEGLSVGTESKEPVETLSVGTESKEPVETSSVGSKSVETEAGAREERTESVREEPEASLGAGRYTEPIVKEEESEAESAEREIAAAEVDFRSNYASGKNNMMEEGQLVLDFGRGEERIAYGQPAPVREKPAGPASETIEFQLNGVPIRLPLKEDGNPYYLMDMIQYSGINLRNPKGKINLMVNGEPGMFQQKLSKGDVIIVEEEELSEGK